jgi:hypothetical protein
MLDIAGKYENQLKELFANITFDENFKFLFGSSYRDDYLSDKSTWNKHEFVSVYGNEVIGYLKYNIDRDANVAYGMQIVNFKSKSNIYFSRDLNKFLIDIFEKFHFRKLKFCCYVGNPIEKMYDKYIKKYGGRIVGIEKENNKLIDGKYYDLKLYEILLEDYNIWRKYAENKM